MQTRQFIIISFVLLSILNSCNPDNNLSENEWISTNSYYFSEPAIYLDLSDNDTLYTTNEFDFNNIKSYKYFIDSADNLIIDDTIFYGKIIKHTKEILLIKDTFRTNSFIPINNYNIKIDTSKLREILITNDWHLSESANTLRIDFFSEPWYVNSSKLSLYQRINESKGWESIDSQWWIIEKYKDSYFLILSYWPFDYQVYQLKSITDSIILAETCWSDTIEEVKFLAQKKLSDSSYKELEKFIIGRWKLTDYVEPIDSAALGEEIIPITRNGRNRPFADEDSVPMILDNYYIQKSINYEFFTNGECLLKSNDKILRSGKWKLSNDGKYINTSYGLMPTMKIISISDSTLTIEKRETIEFIEEINWVDKYIQEKLKKITVPNNAS